MRISNANLLFNLSFVILVSNVFSQSSSGNWQTLPKAPVAADLGRFDDVFFLNPSIGWISNVGDGKIFKTTDGGASWVEQIDAQAEFGYWVGFRSIGFANTQVGWSGNLNSHNNPASLRALFETRDGGQTWSNISDRITGPEPAGICGIWVVNEQLIYAVGRWNGPAIFLKSTDGGNSWTASDLSPMATGLVDVYFFSPDTGIIIGGKGVGSSIEEQRASKSVILHTKDGGNSWENVYESQTAGKWCWKISFPSREVGYVSTQGATGDGVVLKTTDGGLTWQEKLVEGAFGFSGIGFVSENHGWVAATNAYETTNGGETWQEVTNVGDRINRIRIYGDSLGFAVGRTVYKFTGQPSTGIAVEQEPPTAFSLAQNYPNPFNPSTTIRFAHTGNSRVKLTIHDLTGRLVITLVDSYHSPGACHVSWDGTDDGGNLVASGVYIYRMTAGGSSTGSEQGFVQSRKMLLVR